MRTIISPQEGGRTPGTVVLGPVEAVLSSDSLCSISQSSDSSRADNLNTIPEGVMTKKLLGREEHRGCSFYTEETGESEGNGKSCREARICLLKARGG